MYFAEVAEYIDEALKSGGKLTFYCIRNTVIQKTYRTLSQKRFIEAFEKLNLYQDFVYFIEDLYSTKTMLQFACCLILLANSIFIKTFSTTLKI